MAQTRATSGTSEQVSRSSTTRTGKTSAVVSRQDALTHVKEFLSTEKEFVPAVYLAKISELSGVSAEDILGDRRYASIVPARHLFYATLRYVGGWSYPKIASFANRNHTTVIEAVKKVPVSVVESLRTVVEGISG